MPVRRSRQGCEECRRRRRKCDEVKPVCGQCSYFDRTCKYALKLVWGGRKFNKSSFGQCMQLPGDSAKEIEIEDGGFVYGTMSPPGGGANERLPVPAPLPQNLPNGIPFPPTYRRLLSYFTENILASLSCHPSIHQDFCRLLVPSSLHSPHLLSACLTLSATGFLSRGLLEVDGIDIFRILGHLQSFGLSLLRTALGSGQIDEITVATCLIWCLADVFGCRQETSSWRIHLQGIKTLIDSNQAYEYFMTNAGLTHRAMRHLYLLYLSLQTLPHIPSIHPSDASMPISKGADGGSQNPLDSNPKIDGFLGYGEELLHVLQQITQISTFQNEGTPSSLFEADILLGKVQGMISRDANAPPNVSIYSSLSAEYGQEFSLCHKTFQQATLIHVYRRLYHLPSGAEPIQAAVTAIQEMVANLPQGEPCHTWVAMAMPLFTIGCEAFTTEQKGFVCDKIKKFEACISSSHVTVMRQALEDIWRVRTELGDSDGRFCASQLLGELQYNIILF